MARPNEAELRQFMAAIREQESNNNYQARGPAAHERWGRAQGAYQMMSGIWPSWASKYGYDGLTQSQFLGNPEIQDAIAAARMSDYYEQYGDWALVAAAWFGGTGAANKARDRGLNATADISDAAAGQGYEGTNVPTYVQSVIKKMGGSVAGSSRVQADGRRESPQDAAARTQDPIRTPQRQTMQQVMNKLSEAVQREPGNPEMHQMVRDAMQHFVGRDPGFGGEPVDPEVRAASVGEVSPPEPEWPQGGPGEAPGPSMSGVR